MHLKLGAAKTCIDKDKCLPKVTKSCNTVSQFCCDFAVSHGLRSNGIERLANLPLL